MYLNFFLGRQYLLQETKSAVPMHVSYSLLKVVHNTIVHYRIHKNKRCNLILLKVMVLELSENSDFGVVSEVICFFMKIYHVAPQITISTRWFCWRGLFKIVTEKQRKLFQQYCQSLTLTGALDAKTKQGK